MDDDTYPLMDTAKVSFLGVTGAGKSAVVLKFVRDEFSHLMNPTIGAAFLTKDARTTGGTDLRLQIWDTAGEERYHSLLPMYYRGASCIVIVFDITDLNSFRSGLLHMLEYLKEHATSKRVVLIGNKIDLLEEDSSFNAIPNSQVMSEVRNIAGNQYAIHYTKTSAKTGEGVTRAFQLIADVANGERDFPPICYDETLFSRCLLHILNNYDISAKEMLKNSIPIHIYEAYIENYLVDVNKEKGSSKSILIDSSSDFMTKGKIVEKCSLM